MSRWEERKKERDAARERSRTPYVAPEPTISEPSGKASRRGSGVRVRGKYELPNFLQPSQISTPARGGTAGRGVRTTVQTKDSKTAATAQPPVSRGQNLPPSAAVPGTGPEGNTVGSDADPNQPGLQGPGDPGVRINANNIKQYGQNLSDLNKFTSAFTGGYELTDIKSAFQSNALPTTPAGERQGHEGTRTNYSWDSEGETGVWDDKKGMLVQPTAPGTTGSTPDNPQDGTSNKPDVAESIRQVRMERQSGRGSRRDPRNRGENPDMFGGPEPSDESLTSPMYANSKRNAIRSAFLDTNLSSVKAAVAANAVAGYGKDSDGNARFNYGGKLVYAKPGMQQEAKNAAMMGQDPSQYLDIPATPDVEPDTPAASELNPSLQSGIEPGTITAPENKGGSLETTAPITKPSSEKFQEAQDFLTKNMQMLNRRTK